MENFTTQPFIDKTAPCYAEETESEGPFVFTKDHWLVLKFQIIGSELYFCLYSLYALCALHSLQNIHHLIILFHPKSKELSMIGSFRIFILFETLFGFSDGIRILSNILNQSSLAGYYTFTCMFGNYLYQILYESSQHFANWTVVFMSLERVRIVLQTRHSFSMNKYWIPCFIAPNVFLIFGNFVLRILELRIFRVTEYPAKVWYCSNRISKCEGRENEVDIWDYTAIGYYCWKTFRFVVHIFFGELIPRFVVLISTASLVREIRQHGKQFKKLPKSRRKSRNHNQKTINLVLFLFFFSLNTLTSGFTFIRALISQEDYVAIYHPISNLVQNFKYLNLTTATIIYCVTSSVYRKTFKMLFFPKKLMSNVRIVTQKSMENFTTQPFIDKTAPCYAEETESEGPFVFTKDHWLVLKLEIIGSEFYHFFLYFFYALCSLNILQNIHHLIILFHPKSKELSMIGSFCIFILLQTFSALIEIIRISSNVFTANTLASYYSFYCVLGNYLYQILYEPGQHLSNWTVVFMSLERVRIVLQTRHSFSMNKYWIPFFIAPNIFLIFENFVLRILELRIFRVTEYPAKVWYCSNRIFTCEGREDEVDIWDYTAIGYYCWKTFRFVVHIFVGELIPRFVVLISTAILVREIRQHGKQFKKLLNSTIKSRNHNQQTINLVLFLFFFSLNTLTSGFTFVDNFLSDADFAAIYNPISTIMECFLYLNLTTATIIYCVTSSVYRKTFKMLFFPKKLMSNVRIVTQVTKSEKIEN